MQTRFNIQLTGFKLTALGLTGSKTDCLRIVRLDVLANYRQYIMLPLGYYFTREGNICDLVKKNNYSKKVI